MFGVDLKSFLSKLVNLFLSDNIAQQRMASIALLDYLIRREVNQCDIR